jgi:hypothetical protein
MNFLVKILIYLQNIVATETHLAEGLTFTRFRTSKAEKSLNILVGTRKVTVSVMDEQLILFRIH